MEDGGWRTEDGAVACAILHPLSSSSPPLCSLVSVCSVLYSSPEERETAKRRRGVRGTSPRGCRRFSSRPASRLRGCIYPCKLLVGDLAHSVRDLLLHFVELVVQAFLAEV